MEILKLFDQKLFVVKWELLRSQDFDGGFYYKVKAYISDNSELYAKDRVEYQERDYSFHWQDADKQLIIRWDNRPHHPHIKTHPHHKHLPQSVEESHNISLEEVLDFIENKLGLPAPI